MRRIPHDLLTEEQKRTISVQDAREALVDADRARAEAAAELFDAERELEAARG